MQASEITNIFGSNVKTFVTKDEVPEIINDSNLTGSFLLSSYHGDDNIVPYIVLSNGRALRLDGNTYQYMQESKQRYTDLNEEYSTLSHKIENTYDKSLDILKNAQDIINLNNGKIEKSIEEINEFKRTADETLSNLKRTETDIKNGLINEFNSRILQTSDKVDSFISNSQYIYDEKTGQRRLIRTQLSDVIQSYNLLASYVYDSYTYSLSYIQQTAYDINLSVKDTESNINSKIDITKSSISNIISYLGTYTGIVVNSDNPEESYISMVANKFSLRDADKINEETGERIKGKKRILDKNGKITFDFDNFKLDELGYITVGNNPLTYFKYEPTGYLTIGSYFNYDTDGILNIQGIINGSTINGGTITGSTIKAGYIYGTTIKGGSLFIGDDIKSETSHYFSVDGSGNLTANYAKLNNASISGNITANTFSTPSNSFIIDKYGNITASNGTFKDVTLDNAKVTGDIIANSFKSNNETFSIDKDGKIIAKNLNVDGGKFTNVTVSGNIEAQTFSLITDSSGISHFKVNEKGEIEATGATLFDATVTGTISAIKGKIGGFDIHDTFIGTKGNDEDNKKYYSTVNTPTMSLFNEFIVFNDANRQALLGTTSNLGYPILCRLYDENNSIMGSTLLSIWAKNTRNTDTGHTSSHAIYIGGGDVQGFALSTDFIGQDTDSEDTIHNISRNTMFVVCNGSGKYYLPDMEPWDNGHIVIFKRTRASTRKGNPDSVITIYGGKSKDYSRHSDGTPKDDDELYEPLNSKNITDYYQQQTYFEIDRGDFSETYNLQSDGDACAFVYINNITPVNYSFGTGNDNHRGCWFQLKFPRDW